MNQKIIRGGAEKMTHIIPDWNQRVSTYIPVSIMLNSSKTASE